MRENVAKFSIQVEEQASDSWSPENSEPAQRVATYLSGFEWGVMGTLAALVLIGFALRASHLSAIGFAEDEVNKVEAVEAYKRGDITANAEHPMLMKAMMFVAVRVGHALAGGKAYSDETLFRLPNAVFGALTAIPLFLLTAASRLHHYSTR